MNFEEKMLTDPRFKKLGQRLHVSHFEAIGRIFPVWNHAYHRRDALMAADDVDALAELEGFAAALVGAELASITEDGRLRLCGVEEHVAWLKEQDRKRELAADARRKRRGDFPREAPRDVPDQEQELFSLSGSGSPPSELPDPGAIVRVERIQLAPAVSIPPPAPSVVPLRDRRVKLNHDAWQYAALEHARLRGEGISPEAIPWPVMPSGAAMSDLVDRVKELLGDADPPDFAAAAVVLRRRVDVAVAEAKREQHLKWLTPMRLWDAKSFWRAVEQTPAEAAQPRAPARAGPNARASPEEPVRKIPTFR